MKNRFLFVFLIFCCAQILWSGEVWGQSTYTVNDSKNYILPSGNNGATIILNYSGDGWGQIDLGNNTNVTVRISGSTNLGGSIIQSGTAAYTLQVFGTLIGDRTLPSGSVLKIENSGKTSGYGTISMNNGTVTNNGSIFQLSLNGTSTLSNTNNITGLVTLNNSSVYTNSGTQSGQITLNNSSTYSNAGTQSGQVNLNNSSIYNNLSINSGDVVLKDNSAYNLKPTGSQSNGSVKVEGGSFINQTNNNRPVTLSNNGIYINEGTQSATVILAGTSNYINNGTHSGFVNMNNSNSTYTNNGAHSGQLTADNGTKVNNNGTLNLTSLNIHSYSYLTNYLEGSIHLDNGANTFGFQGFITNLGDFSIIGGYSVDNGSTFQNQGNFSVGRDYKNDGKTNSLGGNINIGGSLNVNSGSTFNTSYTSVARDTKIDGTIGLAGELIVNGNLTNNSSGKIVALNANQCNSVIVDGIFFTDASGGFTDNNLNYNNTGSALYVNKEPTGWGVPKLGGTARVGSCLLILPVEFLYFNTTYQNQNSSALISWSSSKEWGNSHFEIERAVNSVKTWETIGRVEGNGYSDMPVEYNFTDDDLPKSGGNVFYRLKQVDYSGQFSYSVTRAVQVPKIDGKNNWTAYPNPSVRGTQVQVELVQAENYHDQTIYISLSNLLGQTKSISLSSPEEISPLISSWLDSSVSGLYILDITWADQSQQIKLLRH